VSSFKLRQDTLDEFVALVDAKGGPHLLGVSPEWHHISYVPTLKVDQSLDPYSDAYCDQQIALYKEISGRELDQYSNEQTEFDMVRHVNQRNAFGGMPSDLALHYARLSKLIVLSKLPANPKVLDMGCGWGMSSEFFASLGCQVTAVDINEKFVELVNTRSRRLDFGINAIHGGFDDVTVTDLYDLVVFYECLHHAIRPWKVIERFASQLAPNGAIALAGEPIQADWWKNWGLRLDPLSIYCIKKFGWFESGWSKPFIVKILRRSGLFVEYIDDASPGVGPVVIAKSRTEISSSLNSIDIAQCCADDNWILDKEYLISKGNSQLSLTYPGNFATARLKITNFRGRGIKLDVTDKNSLLVHHGVLSPGVSFVDLKFNGDAVFVSDVWSPETELGSVDNRQFSFHLAGIELFANPADT
jgi:2-polyprenyl-3-methyl-5-hydroxy-6-metoxy-1,4-benzoquinol methylase